MKLRILSKTNHGIVDYVAAVALVVSPFILGLGTSSPLAIWISVAAGFAVVFVSGLTNYKFSLVKLIPFDLHLAIDLTVATAFMVIPLILGFTGLDAIYYLANAAVVYLVVALTENHELV